MRVLGIDYGEKRIGLAVSDESQTLARELTILSPKEFFSQLPRLVLEYEIETIVIGWPLSMDARITAKTREVESFEQELRKIVSVTLERMDERLSSSMAEHLPGGKKNIDSLAAQIILQNYLDKNKNSK